MEELQTAVLGVTGMTCEHCSARVEKALRGLDGVKEVLVELNSGKAKVTFNSSKTTLQQLHTALVKSGYPPVRE